MLQDQFLMNSDIKKWPDNQQHVVPQQDEVFSCHSAFSLRTPAYLHGEIHECEMWATENITKQPGKPFVFFFQCCVSIHPLQGLHAIQLSGVVTDGGQNRVHVFPLQQAQLPQRMDAHSRMWKPADVFIHLLGDTFSVCEAYVKKVLTTDDQCWFNQRPWFFTIAIIFIIKQPNIYFLN